MSDSKVMTSKVRRSSRCTDKKGGIRGWSGSLGRYKWNLSHDSDSRSCDLVSNDRHHRKHYIRKTTFCLPCAKFEQFSQVFLQCHRGLWNLLHHEIALKNWGIENAVNSDSAFRFFRGTGAGTKATKSHCSDDEGVLKRRWPFYASCQSLHQHGHMSPSRK